MNGKPDLSVIVVNFNTVVLLERCLSSLSASDTGRFRFEIIVVDNASADESVVMVKEKFPGIRLIEEHENTGFAKANNHGIRLSQGKFILLLNSDTEVPKESLRRMLQFMESQPADIATCRLILPDGRMDPACHRGFPTPWAALTYFTGLERLFPKSRLFGQYHLGYLHLNSVHEIDCPSGAFFMVRRSVIHTVGFLDENFFMYAEDIDWAFRMKARGFRILFNPNVTVFHRKKQSGRANQNLKSRIKTNIFFHENNLRFYRKHFKKIYPGPVSFFIESFYGFRIFLLKHFGK